MHAHTFEPDVARVAAAIGEPARATMLHALLGGRWLTAGELGRGAGIAPATASEHLARLTRAGLLQSRKSGRHRYFSLSGPAVAEALESLARILPPTQPPRAGARPGPGETAAGAALRFARTCYDHLAGALGVRLAETLVERGYVAGTGYDVTPAGEAWLATLQIDVPALRQLRRPLTRPCLDWSERRDHVAGSVGAALATTLLERGWLARLEDTRAVRLTVRGREGLYRSLGLEIEER